MQDAALKEIDRLILQRIITAVKYAANARVWCSFGPYCRSNAAARASIWHLVDLIDEGLGFGLICTERMVACVTAEMVRYFQAALSLMIRRKLCAAMLDSRC